MGDEEKEQTEAPAADQAPPEDPKEEEDPPKEEEEPVEEAKEEEKPEEPPAEEEVKEEEPPPPEPEPEPVKEPTPKKKEAPPKSAAVGGRPKTGNEKKAEPVKEIKEEPPKDVELSIACRNLKNKDFLSKSDPMAVVYAFDQSNSDWVEIGRTEMINDDLNPDFATKIILTSRPEMMRFSIYDVDKPGSKPTELLGAIECNLAKVLAAGPHGFTKELADLSDKPTGTIVVLAEEVMEPCGKLRLKISGSGLVGKGLFTPKLFFTLSRGGPGGVGPGSLVYRSEEFKGKEPTWNVLVMPLTTLCGGDRTRELKFEVFKDKKDSSCGAGSTTLNDLLSLAPKGVLKCGDGKIHILEAAEE